MGSINSRPRRTETGKQLRVSVIIPTLNEELHVADAIASALDNGTRDPARSEILVVDGGSKDHTASVARKMGVKVVFSQPGRARQMNLGWLHSQGDCVLFLHADCKLPPGYHDMLHAALQPCKAQKLAWGCFETIDAEVGCNRRQQLLKQAVRFRTRWRHMPYGDQALFVTSSLLREVGGFKELPIMEDYELVSRLRKHGAPAIVPYAIQTSGRRWQTIGFLRTALTNQAIIIAYHCGVPMSTLANWYRKGTR